MREIELFLPKANKVSSPKIAGLWYPGSYQEAISNVGYSAVYSLLQDSPYWVVERFFYDFKKGMISLNGIKACETDALFFSLSWEPHLYNVSEFLKEAGYPFNFKPILVAGGMLSLTDILDNLGWFNFIYRGDAEVYFPELLKELYYQDYQVIIKKTKEYYYLKDLNLSRAYSKFILEKGNLFRSQFLISTMRGCPNNCAFCFLGSQRKEISYLSSEFFSSFLDKLPKKVVDSVGLIATSPDQNPYFRDYLKILVSKGLKGGLSSLRIISNFDEELIFLLKKLGIKGMTFAPDAISLKIAKILHKGVSQEVLLERLKFLEDSGFRHFKLYYILGVPQEDYLDYGELRETLLLLKKKLKKSQLLLSFSHFVPKIGTEMENFSFLSRKEVKKRLAYIKKGLPFKITFNSDEETIIQAFFTKKLYLDEKFRLSNGLLKYPDKKMIKEIERELVKL